MRIVVDIEGVLRGPNGEPISTGVLMVGTLSVYNQLVFMGNETQAELKYWMDSNKVVDDDLLIDSSVKLEGEELAQRQLTVARSRGPVDLFITNNPSMWAFAFDQGIPSVMFGVPAYTRVEFRPDAPKKARSWAQIQEAITAQNIAKTNDARLNRTELLNFE
jgi:hypothetical protein